MAILQRYVLTQLLKVFVLLVLALTFMLVVVGVIGEASKNGLGHEQIFQILPWIVPSLMPYTIPATMLLTVCVVYGRMSGDQEITAIKAAGINVWRILWPSFAMASLLSFGTYVLTDYFIPLARARIEQVITMAIDEIFLDTLRTKNQFTDLSRGISISVGTVEGKKLINPVFRYSLPGGRSATVTAREAIIQFDMPQQQVVLSIDNGWVETPEGTMITIEHEDYPFPLPMKLEPPKPRNITSETIRRTMGQISVELDDLKERQVIVTALQLTRGEFQKFSPGDFHDYNRKRDEATERYNKLNTELHSRVSLACGCFFFTLLGAPFAVLQGKRQFLTSFALCFAPILAIYYPIVLVSMTLGKDNKVSPAWGMWLGNAVLLVAATIVLRRVLRH